MTKKERWLTAIAFVISSFPVIILAFTLKILPNQVTIIDFNSPGEENVYMSKYNNLITAVFYLIPLAVVLVARQIKRKIRDFGNYSAIQCVSIVLSLAFAMITLFGFLDQIQKTDEIKNLDNIGLLAVTLSILIASLGTLLRYRKYNSWLSVNNRFTRASPSVWKAVHRTAGTVQVAGFVILSMLLAFARGIIAVLVLGTGIAIYLIWLYIYSYMIKVVYDSRKE